MSGQRTSHMPAVSHYPLFSLLCIHELQALLSQSRCFSFVFSHLAQLQLPSPFESFGYICSAIDSRALCCWRMRNFDRYRSQVLVMISADFESRSYALRIRNFLNRFRS